MSTASHYESSPTPGRAFPAMKTPPPMEPERPAGGIVLGESLPEAVESLSLRNGEEMLAQAARLMRLRRRIAAICD